MSVLSAKISRSTRSVSFLNSFFSSLVGMASFMLLVRILPPNEFGYWVFFLGVYTLFDMLRAGLLGGATVKFYTSSESEANLIQIEKSILQLAVWTSLLSFLAPILYLWLFFEKGDSELALLAWGMVPLSFVSALSVVATWFAQAKQNFKTILRIRMLLQMSFFLFLLMGFVLDFGLMDVFWAYLIANVLSTLYVLVTGRVRLAYLLGRSKVWESRIIAYGKFSLGTTLGSNLLRNSDTFLLMWMLNATSVAIYNVPNRIMALLEIPLQAFAAADFPRLVAKAKESSRAELQSAFNKGMGLSILVLWPVAIGVFFFAEWVVWLIAGTQYENSVLILRIFSIFAMLLPLDRYAGMMLDALGMPKKNMIKMTSMLIANVALDAVVLELGYGVNAVAAVSLATYTFGITLGLFYLKGQIQLQLVSSVRGAFVLVLTKLRTS